MQIPKSRTKAEVIDMGLFMQPLKIKLHQNIAVTSGQKEVTVATNIIHVELHKARRPSSFY